MPAMFCWDRYDIRRKIQVPWSNERPLENKELNAIIRAWFTLWHKYHANGSLSMYKARLVANRCSVQLDIDCVCFYMHDIHDSHYVALKRILRYICSSLDHGDNLLSWSAKRQATLSRSSAEVEYRGAANVVAETTWVRNLLRELHAPVFIATLVYCDN
ncbi:ribonuclease H-like domain-containing protein, partial [Tanacetum coccineum]